MTNLLTPEERTVFLSSLKRLLAEHSFEAQVRVTMETERGYEPDLWRRLAEMGVVGLVIDPAYGGIGASPVELELVMEEAGAALLCSPFLTSSVLAAALLQAIDDEAAKMRLLPPIAEGSSIATVALAGPKGGWTATDVVVEASKGDENWRLTGESSFVIHGRTAQVILAVARAPDGLAIFEVQPTADGPNITPLPTFDRTLRLARLNFDATPARRLTGEGSAWPAVESALNLARVALAGEQAGAARRIFEITVDYAKTRIQFGRPIGGFQAIKHMAADLLLETESATSAARHAAKSLADRTSEAESAISLAAFACADAFTATAAASIQMHGGIAFTWDHPAHLYLRRARADAQLLGTSAFYRERYLRQLGA